jgi:hypothetical protein
MRRSARRVNTHAPLPLRPAWCLAGRIKR